MMTVTGSSPGEYTCQATVDKFDGTGVEPEMLTYPSPPITKTSEYVNQHMVQV